MERKKRGQESMQKNQNKKGYKNTRRYQHLKKERKKRCYETKGRTFLMLLESETAK